MELRDKMAKELYERILTREDIAQIVSEDDSSFTQLREAERKEIRRQTLKEVREWLVVRFRGRVKMTKTNYADASNNQIEGKAGKFPTITKEKYQDQFPKMREDWCKTCMFWHELMLFKSERQGDELWCDKCKAWVSTDKKQHCRHDLLPCTSRGERCVYWKEK
jgi:hypothetical protein